MEFLLGLGKKETEQKIARQRRLWYGFLAIAALILGLQILFTLFTAPQKKSLARSTTTSPTLIQHNVQPATVLPTHTLVAMSPNHQATSSPTPTSTPKLPTATPTSPPTPTVPATGYGKQPSSSPLQLLSPPHQVSEQTFRLSGIGTAGKSISLLYNHSLIAQTQVGTHGQWQVTIPTSPLNRGENVFQVRDGNGASIYHALTFAPWWLDAPLRLQASLGEGHACAPTTLGMAMDYYHQLDPAYLAPPTTEIVKALEKHGFISGYGADAQMLCDLAITYGYSHSFFYQEWSQAHLRQMLDAGTPVIANVRVDLSTEGYGHSVLIIGLSPDGSRIMFNDPAKGMVEASWLHFHRSWTSFGPPARHGAVIKP